MMAIRSSTNAICRKLSAWSGFYVVILFLLAMSSSLMADGTNAAPVQPAPTGTNENFGQYLAEHIDDLDPLFAKHGDDLIKQGLPLLLAVIGNIILLNILIGWAFDVGIGYGFSVLFAPAYAKLKQALVYATGRLILGILLGIISGLILIGLSFISPVLIIVGIVVMASVSIIAETILVRMVYKTNAAVSFVFFLCLIIVHIIVGSLVSEPLIKVRMANMMAQFMDKNVDPQLDDTVAESKHDLAMAKQAADKAKADMAEAQARLDQANTEQTQLLKDIETKKNSEAYIYSRIVQIHAQGDLTSARDQFTAFLARFPSGSYTDQAKAQLGQIQSELAAEEARKKQAEADDAQAKALARAALLDHAGRGESTLSEMRQALFGKTRAEVSQLFGPPFETASDRWGYSRLMVTNPLTNEKHGLAIYFAEGKVQSVDYYYKR